MAKTSTRTAPSKTANPFGFKTPPPKGPNPGKLTRSTPWTPREADPDEEAKFAARDVEENRRRNARVSQSAITAALARMHGVRPSDEAGDGDGDDEESKQQEQQYDRQYAANELQERKRKLRDEAQAWEGTQAVQQPLPTPPSVAPSHPAMDFWPPTATVAAPQQPTAPQLPPGTYQDPSGISARPLSVQDVDRLWDWIRQDGDAGKSFLGHAITTSLALHTFMQQLVATEPQGLAIIRAIHYQDQHLGFAMLAPILAAERTALMHIYLRKDVRGQLANLAPILVNLATQVAPNVHLAVASADDIWARLHRAVLKPLGFVEHVMFVR